MYTFQSLGQVSYTLNLIIIDRQEKKEANAKVDIERQPILSENRVVTEQSVDEINRVQFYILSGMLYFLRAWSPKNMQPYSPAMPDTHFPSRMKSEFRLNIRFPSLQGALVQRSSNSEFRFVLCKLEVSYWSPLHKTLMLTV